MKIQLVSTHYAPENTGNAPYARDCAESLAARGHAVSVLAGVPHYPGWRVYPEAEWQAEGTESGVEVRRLRAYIPNKPNFVKRFAYEIAHGIAFARRIDTGADVTVVLSPALFAALVLRLRLALAPRRPAIIIWIQDLYSAGVAETPGRLAHALASVVSGLERSLVRSCDDVIVIHDRFRKYLMERFHTEASKVTVVRNWTHISRSNLIPRDEIRARYGWSRPGELIALHAGNMGAKQGLENLVNAAKWAEEHNRAVRFVLMGDGNQRESLERLAAGLGQVQFIAPVPDDEFFSILRAADILLVNERPSLTDSAVPSKLTSYFLTGLPILAATGQGSATSDEIRASGAGLVVGPGDPAALVSGIERLQRSWSEHDAQAGPSYVDGTLSRSTSIETIERVLTQAVSAREHTAAKASTQER